MAQGRKKAPQRQAKIDAQAKLGVQQQAPKQAVKPFKKTVNFDYFNKPQGQEFVNQLHKEQQQQQDQFIQKDNNIPKPLPFENLNQNLLPDYNVPVKITQPKQNQIVNGTQQQIKNKNNQNQKQYQQQQAQQQNQQQQNIIKQNIQQPQYNQVNNKQYLATGKQAEIQQQFQKDIQPQNPKPDPQKNIVKQQQQQPKEKVTQEKLPYQPFMEDDEDPDNAPVPTTVQIGKSPVYLVEKKLGKGGFGQVYSGRRLHQSKNRVTTPNDYVAIKFEPKSSKGCSRGSPYEWSVYGQLNQTYGVPKLYFKGEYQAFYIMILEHLGPSLWDVWSTQGNKMNQYAVAALAIECILILQAIHVKGYVHGDMKPENLLFGKQDTPDEKKIFLCDLGLAAKWKDRNNHVKYNQRLDDFRGTIRYASVHSHLGRTVSRRDDLESLAYTLIFLIVGRLPWQGYQGDDKAYWVCKKKMNTSAEQLTKGCNEAYKIFTDCVINLKFEEEPKYDYYISLFEPLVNKMPKNIIEIRKPEKHLGKRNRDYIEMHVLQENKKSRIGVTAHQWITIYNKHNPMKQRYHYNVVTSRVEQHVKKGYKDDLSISHLSSYVDTWAIIMDAGTGYSEQVYSVALNQFLPKEWILEKWEEGFYITSVAGQSNNSSFVVMSKGTSYTQQSYKVADQFPFEWVKKKWKDGFMITSMACGNHNWVVVMSRNADFLMQTLELDFQYPSEGIHKRWDEGYRITSMAVNNEQACFVLSHPFKRYNPEETQETLRTSYFPTQHVKDKWSNNLYIAGIAYGRTTS